MDWDEIRFTVKLLAGLLLVVCTTYVGTRMVDHHYTTITCSQFAAQTGRETKMADYTFWNYDCLTRTENGKWLPASQLREINP